MTVPYQTDAAPEARNKREADYQQMRQKVLNVIMTPSDPDYQLQINSNVESNATGIKLTSEGTIVRGSLSSGPTTISLYNKDINPAAGALHINQTTGNLGFNTGVPEIGADFHTEILGVGDSSNPRKSRFRFLGYFTSKPADPPSGNSDMFILDDGANIQFWVRYNDGGVVKENHLNIA